MKDPKESFERHHFTVCRRLETLTEFFEAQADDKNGCFWDGPKAICKNIESDLSKVYDDFESVVEDETEWSFLPEVRVMYPFMKHYVDEANKCAKRGVRKRAFVGILILQADKEYQIARGESFDKDAFEIQKLLNSERDPQKRRMMALAVRCLILSTEDKEKHAAFLQDLSKLSSDEVSLRKTPEAQPESKLSGA